MPTTKSSRIEELIQNGDDADAGQVYERGAPGRRRSTGAKPQKSLNASQAWRTLEDRLNEKRLKRKLREIYEDD